MTEYIVSSGDGYFIRFDNNTPFMDSDPVSATRMRKTLACEIIDKLIDLGYCAGLIKIIHARIREVM